ncbi:phosphoesterase, MJ0936 family [Sphaerochaeta pleomorpha str. Grapes]|uniref:Phosphoesterase n=1 Tax=Sphaerochaeta pleomorpha (strain ATCC BAA-1885 / DSM 22778 / Grapes) TaxID=158190 RepID=G8QZ08_SPHPG|nr:metallophosphoesterase family protein [Sphaerochaeta pleomorpha]AEV30867.1 phosphoesterase, MJ0936 family [Sphaerochaeta pleomorpha str. Grapes]
MKIAFISDIHGNLQAFEAVVKDFTKEHVEAVIFLGDLIFYGLYPRQCYDLLVSLHPICCIKGNTDANLEELETFVPVSPQERILYENIQFCNEQLSPEAKVTIASWPIAKRITLENEEILVCHGSPYHFKDQLSLQSRQLEELAARIEKEPVNHIYCGHTHIPQIFSLKEKRIVNAGAVGYSFDRDNRASYCLTTIEKGQWENMIKRVEYPVDEYAKEVLAIPRFGHNLWYILKQGTFEKKL